MGYRSAFAALVIGVSVIALPAAADVVWPAILLEKQILAWYSIALGLVVEYIFVRWCFREGLLKSFFMTVVMNLFSTIVGIVLIPLLGLAWEFFPGQALYGLLGGTFNPVTWGATFLLAVAANGLIEWLALFRFFNTELSRRNYLFLFAANACSVAIAFSSMFVIPE